MELLFLILFIILITILSSIEYLEYRTIVTPFTVMTFPYLIIIIFVNLFGWHRSYFPITSESISFVAINITLFWLAGQSVWSVSRGIMQEETSPAFVNFVKKCKPFLRIIVVVGVLSGIIHFAHVLSLLGWQAIGTELFQSIYTSGILAHITISAYPSFILLGALWIKEKNKLDLALLFLMIAIVLLNQIKYRTILLLLPTFYLAMQSKLVKKLTFLKLIGVITIIFVVFISAYLIGFSATLGFEGFEETFKIIGYTFRAFEDYIVAGPITLGSFLKFPENYLPTEIVFTAPINICRFISGSRDFIIPIIKNFFPLSSNISIPNNTGTMFATLYLCLGYYGSLIFMALLGILVYLIYNISFKTNSIILNLLSSQFLAILTVSFFSYYFSMLLLWEVGIGMIITPILLSLLYSIFSRESLLK